MEFFENLDPLLRAFYYVAIPASILFVLQTIMGFIGADSDSGDFDSGEGHGSLPDNVFTLKNLVNFLLGFGWAGISFYSLIPNTFLLVLVAFLTGVAFVWIIYYLISQLVKLSEDNSFQWKDAINQTAEVYLPIPGEKAGRGRVLISIRGSVHEMEAMTEDGAIPQGTTVKVVRVENQNTLIVQELSNYIPWPQ